MDARADGTTFSGDQAGLDTGTARQLGVLAGPVGGREVRARLGHARLRARDTTLWPPEAAITGPWLGWLDSLDRAAGHLHSIEPLVAGILADGIRDVVLTGMGGSSLFPIVLQQLSDRRPGFPILHVIDSTDPAAVERIEREVDWAHAVIVAASKSGGTVETRAHLDRYLARLTDEIGDRAVGRVIVITDPGSALALMADERGFRAIVHGDADVGGRYSALSPFGLLPAALLGVDTRRLLTLARTSETHWREDPWSDAGPALLATFLACAVDTGRDVLYLVTPDGAGAFGAWVEQLVAESSGKDGTGVLPVVVAGSDVLRHIAAPDRCIVVTLGPTPALDELGAAGIPVLVVPWAGVEGLASEALRWMHAVPLLCSQLGVDPFDQPDVTRAKTATASALAQGTELEDVVAVATLGASGGPYGYVAILAYVDPDGPMVKQLEGAAAAIGGRFGCPVTVGIGPRYLHSTGQLHKGGRSDGLFLVVVADDPVDVAIPGWGHGFSRLKRAQAAGDLAALRGAGRTAGRVDPDDPGLQG